MEWSKEQLRYLIYADKLEYIDEEYSTNLQPFLVQLTYKYKHYAICYKYNEIRIYDQKFQGKKVATIRTTGMLFNYHNLPKQKLKRLLDGME